MKYSKVIIIVLNWNGKEDTVECLESLKYITYPNYQILLVDNGSTDDSVECFIKQFPEIEIIENKKNLGFAEGNNVGIREAVVRGAEYVLLLNNDTVVDSDFLEELIKVAEKDKEIGFVGPKVYYYEYEGRKDVINFAGGNLSLLRGKSSNIGVNQIDNGQHDDIKNVDFIQGSCLLAKKELIDKVGMLDSTYFAYWEETDWCLRGYKHGYKSVYVPKAKIWHKIARSSKNSINEYYMSRNKFLFMKKQASRRQLIIFTTYFFGYQLWRTSLYLILFEKNKKKLYRFLEGVKDGILITVFDKNC